MRLFKSLRLCVLLCAAVLPVAVTAQEATDRPFPTAAATATDRPFPGVSASATDRPFPVASTPATQSVANPAVTSPTVEPSPELLLVDIQATANAAQAQIVLLEAEREGLRAELAASQSDNGATTFAIVIIVLGVLLATAVFFGLRRSGE